MWNNGIDSGGEYDGSCVYYDNSGLGVINGHMVGFAVDNGLTTRKIGQGCFPEETL